MGSDDEAKKAIEMLNGKDFTGRNIVVNEARPREEPGHGEGEGGLGVQEPGPCPSVRAGRLSGTRRPWFRLHGRPTDRGP